MSKSYKQKMNEIMYTFMREYGSSERIPEQRPNGLDDLIELANNSSDIDDFLCNLNYRVDEKTVNWFKSTYAADVRGIRRASYDFIIDVEAGTFK